MNLKNFTQNADFQKGWILIVKNCGLKRSAECVWHLIGSVHRVSALRFGHIRPDHDSRSRHASARSISTRRRKSLDNVSLCVFSPIRNFFSLARPAWERWSPRILKNYSLKKNRARSRLASSRIMYETRPYRTKRASVGLAHWFSQMHTAAHVYWCQTRTLDANKHSIHRSDIRSCFA